MRTGKRDVVFAVPHGEPYAVRRLLLSSNAGDVLVDGFTAGGLAVTCGLVGYALVVTVQHA